MSMGPGTRIGPYEIVAPLGAGGMGEVYRARDAKLGREVAIKVLPASVAQDPARRQRFEQEARSASSLNHPNILTIHDIAEADGALYIAMELVDGRTLRELIASGEPLPTKRLLDLAVQIADGLAKAHSAGIVHRDLKPENLMVSRDGFVKILDFGLAKLTEPAAASDASVLPTAVAAPTEPGTVMGTAGYMSPEQASGQPVDYRSDQFSLGAILYEMATGHRAFQRKTGAETLAAIIRDEPVPLAQAAPKAPAPVRWIVERLLAKDPEERYASTKDLARDLRSVRDHLSETSVSGGIEAAERPRRRRRGWLGAIALIAAGIAIGFLARGRLPHRPDSSIRFTRLTFSRGTIFSARFARDGQTIYYGASWEGGPLQIYSTRADSQQSRSVDLPPADVLAISPAGEMAVSLGHHETVGFESRGTLARVPLGGGAPREVLDNVVDADWSPDGQALAVAHFAEGRYRLEYPIGKVIYEAAVWLSHVRVSPDGKLVAFLDHPEIGDNLGVLKVVDTSGRVRLTGPADRISLAWSPRGDEIWTSVPLEATSLSGKTRTLWASSSRLDRIADVAPDGRVLFLRASSRREIVGVDAAGQPKNLTWFDWCYPSDVSGAMRAALFDVQSNDTSQVFVRKFDGSAAVHLADGKSFAFSPDGRFALAVTRLGLNRLLLVPTGTGEPRTLLEGPMSIQWASFSPDGRRVVVSGIEPGQGTRMYVFDMPSGKPRPIGPEGVMAAPGHAISPDGSRIAAPGRDGIGLYPLDGGEVRTLTGSRPSEVPVRWTRDGIYVYRPDLPGHLDVLDVATGTRRAWKEVVPPDPAGVTQIEPFVMAEDGSIYLYSYRRILDELELMTGVR
ncbi:MAG TPA: serine/threonine-protein kinase [Thermoanaerobaculia bacterium]|nr:serine/threonine-protein kinase [Thermoanaerobaculia bacterium]